MTFFYLVMFGAYATVALIAALLAAGSVEREWDARFLLAILAFGLSAALALSAFLDALTKVLGGAP